MGHFARECTNKGKGKGKGSQFQKGRAGLYQVPRQLACALRTLFRFSIWTFVEVGTNTGWTAAFINAFLRRAAALRGETFRGSFTADVNPFPNSCAKEVPGLHAHIWNATSAAVVREKLALKEGEKVGLCFIDGDHSVEGVWRDTEELVSLCSYFMFHDINDRAAPGVVSVWEDIKQMHPDNVVAECLQQSNDWGKVHLRRSLLPNRF